MMYRYSFSLFRELYLHPPFKTENKQQSPDQSKDTFLVIDYNIGPF